MIQFGIAGSGWRSEFFLRIAAAAPERFHVTGLLSRGGPKSEELGAKFAVPIVSSVETLLHAKPEFVVVSVPWVVAPEMTVELARRGMPVLCETPPAPDEDALLRLHQTISGLPGARVQVAEQYVAQPLHAARLGVIERGWLGRPSFAHVSAAHGYHGISLIRRYLGTGFKIPSISARAFAAPIVAGPGRDGPPEAERVHAATQLLAYLDFDEALGVFDFCGEQYFSWIRAPHVMVRGERGEIQDETVRWLVDFRTPLAAELRREVAGAGGNLEGLYLKGYTAAGEWIYRNPVAPARLADDEVAIATCLIHMSAYAAGGAEFYPLREAMHDRYIDIWMERAREHNGPLKPPVPPWCERAEA